MFHHFLGAFFFSGLREGDNHRGGLVEERLRDNIWNLRTKPEDDQSKFLPNL